MKKCSLIFACVLLVAGITFAQEENETAKEPIFGVGVKAAFDYGMMYGFEGADEESEVDQDPSGFGFSAGLAFRIRMVENFYFAPEVDIAYMSTSHKYVGLERSSTTTSIEIPFLLRGVVAKKFYVTAGPQLSFKLAETNDIDDGLGKNDKEEIREYVEQGSMDFGIAAGFGYNIVAGLFVDARAYMGLMEIFPDVTYIYDEDVNNVGEIDGPCSQIDMAGAKMMKFRIGISYWFM